MKAYAVKSWNAVFEKADTRQCKRMLWVAVPNTHETAGFATLMQMPDGMELYAAWILMVQVASKMQKRGVLVHKGRPLTAKELALRTRGDRAVFERALDVLSGEEIAWLELVDW